MNIPTGKYFEPVREINSLALENVEKLLDIQLQSINDTARLGVEQLRSAAEVKDADSLKRYLTDQAETARALGERFIRDSQTALELGVSYTDKVQQIVTGALRQDAPAKAASTAKAAAETSSKTASKSA